MDNKTFVLPSPTEKLSYKFILDTLKESQKNRTPEELPPTEPGPESGTEVGSGYLPTNVPADKRYFRMGEVSQLLGVEPYVLRYWEGEFKKLRPTKSGSGHRVYSRRDVELLARIKHLVHIEKFSIKGAKKQLETLRNKEEPATNIATSQASRAVLKEIQHGLRELIHLARENSPGY